MNYVRIKFKAAGFPARWYWAVKVGKITYKVVGKDGEPDETVQLLLGEPLEVRPARMNLKYAKLELEVNE